MEHTLGQTDSRQSLQTNGTGEDPPELVGKLECILLPRSGERGVEESLAASVAWETAWGAFTSIHSPTIDNR